MASCLAQSLATCSAEWTAYFQQSAIVPASLQSSLKQSAHSSNYVKLFGLLLCKELKREQFTAEATKFIDSVLGHDFFPEDVNFSISLERDINPKYPILLCSKPGYDASSKIDELAESEGIRNYSPIAIGSREGFDTAEKAIELGMAPYD